MLLVKMLEWQNKQPRFQVRWLKGGKQIIFGLLTALLLETNQCEEFQFVIDVNLKQPAGPILRKGRVAYYVQKIVWVVDSKQAGVARRKPGRGNATMSMSCNDKLARWNVVGLQGSLVFPSSTSHSLGDYVIKRCPLIICRSVQFTPTSSCI